MKVLWNGPSSRPNIVFADLQLNEAFRIVGGHGAVYVKVETGRGQKEEYMYELATGKLWTPTRSVVERISVSVAIDTTKPACY